MARRALSKKLEGRMVTAATVLAGGIVLGYIAGYFRGKSKGSRIVWDEVRLRYDRDVE